MSLHYGAMCDCVGRSFLHTQGRTYENTHVRTTWRYKYRVLAFQFDFWKKIQIVVFMLRVFTAHFSPVKCSKTIFRKRVKPLVWYRGTIQSGHYKMPQEHAWYLYLKHQLSAASELSPTKYNIPVCFNHAPNPLTWWGIAGQMYHVLTFCIVPLVQGKWNPNCLVVWYMNDQNKIWTFMLEFHVCFISPLHSNDFQLLCSRYIGLHKLRTPNAFPLSINLSFMKYWRQKKIHIRRRNIEFTYSQVTTSECIHVWNKKQL